MTSTFTKDPDSLNDPYHVVWCSLDSTNDGSASDDGKLQGATIASSDWTVPSGLTEASATTSAISIQGVSYATNTVATIYLNGGTAGTDYTVVNQITTSDSPSRTLDRSIIIRCVEK